MKACLLLSCAGLRTGHMARINTVCWVLALCQTYNTIPSYEGWTDEQSKHTKWVSTQGGGVSEVSSFTVRQLLLLAWWSGVLLFVSQNKNNNHKTPRSDSLGGKRASSLPSWVFTHLSCDCASSIARQLASHLPLSSKAKLPPRSCFSYIPTVVLSKKVIAGARLFILILPQMAFILFRPRHTSSKIYFKWMGSFKKKKKKATEVVLCF